MYRVVLLRHGQSAWNRANRFTGWTDVDLSPAGVREARAAAHLIAGTGFEADYAFTSVLRRAVRTLWIVQEELDRMWIPVLPSWRLNERHYGALQGLDKAEAAAVYGEEQVHLWRRGYAVRPPQLRPGDPRDPANDDRYRGVPTRRLPRGESLADTVARVLPYWKHCVVPRIRAGRHVLVSAHGNSIRALVKHLDRLSDSEVVDLEIPTGRPLVYEFGPALTPLRRYYLSDSPTSTSTAIDAT